MFDTIVALATPPLKSALAIIRMSGPKTEEILDAIFKSSRKIEPNYVRYGKIINPDDEQMIDEVMATFFQGPHSFTGEDMAEISCHGSVLIANQIIEMIIKLGARYAERGEFTSRAFYNQKIDLVQAEAINDLINAKSYGAKNLSLNALKGETSKLLFPLVEDLASLLANIEVNIDYPEYKDIEELTYLQIQSKIINCQNVIDDLIKDGKKNIIVLEGVKVALVGEPNVGKSSLLNALIAEDKAIVTSTPGTTRDVVEGEIVLEGVLIHLFDTAGIRETTDPIERLGIQRSIKNIEESDLVIYVKDQTEEQPNDYLDKLLLNKNVITVYNKSDLLCNLHDDKLKVSALNNDIGALKNAIVKELHLNNITSTKPSLCSARQIALLEKAAAELHQAIEESKLQTPLDLVSIHIKSAYDYLNELLGREIRVDLEKEIFARFCVGK